MLLFDLFFSSYVSGNWSLHLGPHSDSGSSCPAGLLYCGADLPLSDVVFIIVTLLESQRQSPQGKKPEGKHRPSGSQYISQAAYCVPGLTLAPAGNKGHPRAAISG